MEKRIHFMINIFFYGIIFSLIFVFCKYIMSALIPFLIAIGLAAMVQVPAKRIAGTSKKGRQICAMFLCFLVYLVLLIIVTLFGIGLMKEAENLMEIMAQFYTGKLEPFLDEIVLQIEGTAASIDEKFALKVRNLLDTAVENMKIYRSEFSVKLIKWISEMAKKVPGIAVKLIITVVSTFFIASDFDKMMEYIKKIVPSNKQMSLQKGISYMKYIVGIYVKSYSLLFFMSLAELSAGLLILRIPYAVLIALAIAIFDILPVLGTGGILIPWAVILIFMRRIPLAIGIIILYIVVTVIRNIVEPKLVGKQIGLHPVVTLAIMFVGLRVFGIFGMLVFPIAFAFVINLKREQQGIKEKKAENDEG